MSKLTHLDDDGHARMVDVSQKNPTNREAVASGKVRMSEELVSRIRHDTLPKGDVLAAARIGGIMAAKRTPELIPLCHGVALTSVTVDLRVETDGVHIEACAIAADRTGVEMEALTAVSVAALTLYDMCKAVDRGMVIEDVRLRRKSGGRSGAT